MTTTKLSDFAWRENNERPQDCLMFECNIGTEHKMIVWALGFNQQCGKKIEECDSFNFNIILRNKLAVDWNEHTVTRSYLEDNALPTHHIGFDQDELVEIMDKCGGELCDSLKFTAYKEHPTKASVARDKTCSECNGTGIIDTGFYKRACMRCYKE